MLSILELQFCIEFNVQFSFNLSVCNSDGDIKYIINKIKQFVK
jgi:hypothetical protein